MLDTLQETAYRMWCKRALPEQQSALPDSYDEYISYREKYGTYPGEAVVRDGDACLVHAVEGPPTMNARVEYKNLETGKTYTTGLGNFQRKIDRKT